jgi:uncharacterized protein
MPAARPVLSQEMHRVIAEQRLGFVATVCPDGTPNLSPKGTVVAFGDDQLVFADLRSPRTVANLRHNPAVEVNVVDPVARKGYRFKGTGTVLTDGQLFDQLVEKFARDGLPDAAGRIRSIVLIKVERAAPLTSPAYDLGQSEQEVRARWMAHFQQLWEAAATVANGQG